MGPSDWQAGPRTRGGRQRVRTGGAPLACAQLSTVWRTAMTTTTAWTVSSSITPALHRPLPARPAWALRRGERAWLPRLRRAPRVGRCSDACRTRPCPLQTCGLERATLASCGKCPNHHPAHQASSAAIAKLLISRAIRQGGKERRIRTAKFSAIGESLADES